MPHGMRRAIANVAGITCASFISSTCAELLILYTTYDDFQQEVDRLLNKVYSIIKWFMSYLFTYFQIVSETENETKSETKFMWYKRMYINILKENF